MRISVFIGLVLVFPLLISVQPQASTPILGIELTLQNGMRKGGYAEIPYNLYVNLVKRGDTWLPAGGHAPPNKGIAHGYVEEKKLTDSDIELRVSLWYPPDPSQSGGRAIYDLKLTRSGDKVSGSYTGEFWGTGYTYLFVRKATEADRFGSGDIVPPRGSVTGSIRESRTEEGSYGPSEDGVHPHILFRNENLPHFDAKAKTVFGEKALAKMMSSPSGMCIRYQIAEHQGNDSEAKKYAGLAQQFVTQLIGDLSNGVDEHGRIAWGMRAEEIAKAYDLCYDAWGKDFREKVAWRLIHDAKAILDFHGEWRGSEQSFTVSFYGINWYAGIGLSGMALQGESGLVPLLFKWFGDGKRAPTLSAPLKVELPNDIESTRLEFRGVDNISLAREPGKSGTIPLPKYMVATTSGIPMNQLLKPFGESPNIAPRIGQSLGGGFPATWRLLEDSEKKIQSTPWTPAYETIDLAQLTGRENYSVTYFYAVLDNDAPRWVETVHSIYHEKFSSPLEAQYFIDGVQRLPGDFTYLEAGRHSLLVIVPTLHFQSWGTMSIAPRLVEPSEERRKANLAFFDKEKNETDKYEAVLKNLGTGDPYFTSILHRARFALGQFYQELNGGSFPRTKARCLVDNMAAKWGMALKTTTGITANPFWDMQSGIETLYGGSIPVMNCSYVDQKNMSILNHAFGLLPRQKQEGLKSKWLQAFGAGSPNDADALISEDPIYAFLNFPLDVQVSPLAPDKAMVKKMPQLMVESSGSRGIRIRYNLPSKDRISIQVLDIEGRQVRLLDSSVMSAGEHELMWSAAAHRPGLYYIRLQTAQGQVITERGILLKK